MRSRPARLPPAPVARPTFRFDASPVALPPHSRYPMRVIRVKNQVRSMLPRFLLAAAACLAAAPALAHPHVYVIFKSEIVFAPDGKVAAIRHAWTFDEFYSAFAVQGLGKDGKDPTREDLAPLAKVNTESLAEFGYFTIGKAGGKQVDFDAPKDEWLDYTPADKAVTLHFTLPLKAEASAGKAFSLQVYDPTYFVSFEFNADAPVALANAPAGCSVNVAKPPPLLANETKTLSESFFSGQYPGADFGIKLAGRAIVACP